MNNRRLQFRKQTTSAGCLNGCLCGCSEVETNTHTDTQRDTLLNSVRSKFSRGTLCDNGAPLGELQKGDFFARVFARINAHKVERKNAQLDTLTGDTRRPLPTTTAQPSRRSLLLVRSPYQPARPRHAAQRALRWLNAPRPAQGYHPNPKRAPGPLSVRVGGYNP